jgi:dipeptidyl aminopeptidase/acylaminoacyl peptidase
VASGAEIPTAAAERSASPGVPAALAAVGTVAEPRWSPDGRRLAWVRATPHGRVLVVDGHPLPDLVPAGTRGGTFAWLDADRVLVVAEAGLHTVRVDGAGPGTLTVAARGRAAAPAVCAADGLVAFVDDTGEECRVVVAPLDGSREPWPVSTADFAWDPAWSAGGTHLAWHEWDAPAMPWDGSRIVVGTLTTGETAVVAGGPSEAVGQPRFAPAGPTRLGFVCDRDGWTNVTVADPDGHRGVVIAEPHEHAEPSWGPGQRSFAWSPDARRLAWCRNEAGFGRLVAATVPDRGGAAPPAEWSRGWHHGLDWGPGGLAAVRSGARTPPTIVVQAGDPGSRRVVETAAGAERLPVDAFVEPRAVSWPVGDGADRADVPGLLFSPPSAAPAVPPPLLVHVHGGPTDQARAEWSPRVQHFVARGWAVLAPNARGSTGYGRTYAQALRGGWGERDVDDVLAGIRAAAALGWGDPHRVAVVGGSAGGLTALLAAVRAPDAIGAVVASYPVTDLHGLAAETWRFERHYNDSLIGPLPAAADAWRERSPRTHAASLRVPLLVLHGDTDPVVPLAHTSAFVEAVRDAGGDARLHVYAGEGHGWSRPETAADAIRRTDEFLTRTVLRR